VTIHLKHRLWFGLQWDSGCFILQYDSGSAKLPPRQKGIVAPKLSSNTLGFAAIRSGVHTQHLDRY